MRVCSGITYYSGQGATLMRKDVLKAVPRATCPQSPRVPGMYAEGESDGRGVARNGGGEQGGVVPLECAG